MAAGCHDVVMPDRNLKIVRFIGATPSAGYCDICKLMFKTRPEFVVDAEKARQQLQADFDHHECRPETDAVLRVLDNLERE
jgi:hypothetical protein